jgi:hypothetical protein
MSCGVASFLDGSVQCGEPDAEAPTDSAAPADPADDPMTGDSSATPGETTFSIYSAGSARHSGPPDTRLLDALAQARGVDPKNGTYVYVFRAEELGASQSSPEATPE